eukprot:145940-Pyramimonas_sp.AAC.1
MGTARASGIHDTEMMTASMKQSRNRRVTLPVLFRQRPEDSREYSRPFQFRQWRMVRWRPTPN